MSMNPNNPNAIGLEWFPIRQGSDVLASAAGALAFLIEAGSSETIDQLILPSVWSGPAAGHGKLWVDVYDYADVGAGATVTEYAYLPNEDELIGAWRDNSAGSSNIYLDANQWPATSADYIVRAAGTASPCAFHFATAGFPAATRPLAVYIDVAWYAAMGLTPFPGEPAPTLVQSLGGQLFLYNNATQVAQVGHAALATVGSSGVSFTDLVTVTTFGPFYINPLTDEPWSRQDILDFDNAALLGWGYDIPWTTAPSNHEGQIFGTQMRVLTIPEKRVAVGGMTALTAPPVGVQTNNPLLLETAAGVDNWAKASGTDYLVVARRLDDGAVLSGTPTLTPALRYIDGGVAPPHVSGRAVAVTMASDGSISAVGAEGTKAYGVVMGTSGSATSDESQPYHTVKAYEVNLGADARQTFLATAAAFPAARMLIGIDRDRPPTTDLEVSLHLTADDSQLGGTIIVTYPLSFEDVNPRSWSTLDGISRAWLYDFLAEFDSLPTLTAASHYIKFLAPTAAVAEPWLVAVLDSEETNALTGNATFGGSTYLASSDGVTDAAEDIAAIVLSETAAVTGFEAVPALVAIDDPGPDSCDPGQLGYIELAWDASSVGASFAHYEIQRQDRVGNEPDGSSGWQTIARITDESIEAFNDFECQSNVDLAYQIRVVRTDGGVSLWAQWGDIRAFQAPGTVFLTSNATVLDIPVAGFVLLGAVHEYGLLTAGDRRLGQFYDRDYQVEFRPTERRGIQYGFRVLVYGALTGTPAWGTGLRAFDLLRTFSEAADLPYVCVRTAEGLRIFGSLVTGQPPSWDAETNFYSASLVVTETTAQPSVADVAPGFL